MNSRQISKPFKICLNQILLYKDTPGLLNFRSGVGMIEIKDRGGFYCLLCGV